MDLSTILAIIQMATNLAAGLTSGKTAEELKAAAVFEAMAGKVAQAHQEIIGTPIDPSSLKYESPIV